MPEITDAERVAAIHSRLDAATLNKGMTFQWREWNSGRTELSVVGTPQPSKADIYLLKHAPADLDWLLARVETAEAHHERSRWSSRYTPLPVVRGAAS